MKKETTFNMKLSLDEKTVFENVAAAQGLSLSAWVRTVCLASAKNHMGKRWKEIDRRIDNRVYSPLRKNNDLPVMGANQKIEPNIIDPELRKKSLLQ
jgi:ribosomal protein S13